MPRPAADLVDHQVAQFGARVGEDDGQRAAAGHCGRGPRDPAGIDAEWPQREPLTHADDSTGQRAGVARRLQEDVCITAVKRSRARLMRRAES